MNLPLPARLFPLSLVLAACAPGYAERESEGRLEFPGAAAAWRLMRYQDEQGRIPERAWQLALEARERMVAACAVLPTTAGGVAPGAWVQRGPSNVAGRSRTLVIDPRNPQRMFCGGVGGGLWRSTNGGTSWTLIDDWWRNLSIGSLAMDPQNPDTMYVGTGDGFFSLAHPLRSFSHFVRGAGVLKSTDGGQTWNHLANTANWQHTTRIAVSPNNSNLVLASRRPGGIARSTDGGLNWTDVQAGDVFSYQVVFDPNDPTKLVAHLAPNSVVSHRVLTSVDAGLTWQPAQSGLGSVAGESSRIELCYARSAPGVVYASVGSSGSVWRSADGGRNWVQRGSGTGTSYYYNGLWVDPTNENLLVVSGLNVFRSTNGGSTLTGIGNGYIMTVVPHPDVHAVVADPGYNATSNRRVYVTTDGGVHCADDILAASSSGGWRDLDQTMRSTQFYGAAGHGTGDVIVGGTQDNGTLRVVGASATANLTFGGDGGHVQIDPTNPNYVYGEIQWLGVHRSSNGGSSSTSITSGLTDAGSLNTANFISPLRLDPNDPNRLYAGGLRLWRTQNPRSGTTWTSIKATVGSLIASLAITPGAADRIYVGHNDGRVYRTTNGTAAAPTWLVVDDNGAQNPLPNRVVTRLIVDPTNTARVYATFGGFNADNLWRSTDSGLSWQPVLGTGVFALPAAPVYCVAVHPDDGNVLYAATEVGLFTSDDFGAHWSASNEGPANVVCEEVTFMHTTRRLLLATLGRGLWTADVARPRAVAFGTACAGHSTPPTLAMDPLAPARIGHTMNLLGADLRIGQAVAVLFLGFYNTTWNGIPLPFDLTPAGMNGCPLLVSLDLLMAAAISGSGTATWSLAIPGDRSLLGGRLFTQAVAPDPGLNPAGVAVSRGLELTLGW